MCACVYIWIQIHRHRSRAHIYRRVTRARAQVPRDKGGLGAMNIPILADITKSIARSYGVLLEEKGIALRGLFILDSKHVIRHATINDLPIGRNVDEELRTLRAVQFTDEHGEVRAAAVAAAAVSGGSTRALCRCAPRGGRPGPGR
jgi:peroxiredoxin